MMLAFFDHVEVHNIVCFQGPNAVIQPIPDLIVPKIKTPSSPAPVQPVSTETGTDDMSDICMADDVLLLDETRTKKSATT